MKFLQLSNRLNASWRVLFVNTSFMIANTLAGSAFGFLFWMVVTRFYDVAQVGTGVAYIAAITLLANLSEMGLGIALIRFAPTIDQQNKFINTNMTAVAFSTLIITGLFLAGTAVWSPELQALTGLNWQTALFWAAALAFSVAQFLDKLFVAFEATHFMLLRNVAAHLIRLGVVASFGRILGAAGILLAVGIGAVVTLLLSSLIFAPRTLSGYVPRFDWDWQMLWSKAQYSLGNHFSQLLWNVPPLIYPLIIVSLLGAEANAHFYISWMIANVLFVFPTALSMSVFARAANENGMDHRQFWRIMTGTLAGLLPLVGVMMALSAFLLRLFGGAYVTGGQQLLIFLLLSALPYTVNTFVVVSYRIRKHIRGVVFVSGFTALVCLIMVVVLGKLQGVAGIGIGWLVGQSVGLLFSLSYWRFEKRLPHVSTTTLSQMGD
ncbi:MAG: lipopolysaccharide biosynthesis protein [Anaerolineales bacterium]|nr:lipopolysaccharide biosynthesis protein [Anaerolineales bacterium]